MYLFHSFDHMPPWKVSSQRSSPRLVIQVLGSGAFFSGFFSCARAGRTRRTVRMHDQMCRIDPLLMGSGSLLYNPTPGKSNASQGLFDT